jgi:hypothetical protein
MPGIGRITGIARPLWRQLGQQHRFNLAAEPSGQFPPSNLQHVYQCTVTSVPNSAQDRVPRAMIEMFTPDESEDKTRPPKSSSGSRQEVRIRAHGRKWQCSTSVTLQSVFSSLVSRAKSQ